MSSSYLKNLYQDNGYYYTSNMLGMKQPVNYTPGQWTGIGGSAPRWQSGSQQSVVHDTLNNKYYGTQSFDQITKGLTDHIARTQAQLDRGYGYNTYAKDTMWERQERYNYSAKDKQNLSTSIANQQKYLSSITKNNYTKEADTFFDSYEAYTGDWNNVFARRKSNADQTERNRLQAIENEKTLVRNKKIEGQNQTLAQKEREAENAQITTGSKARAKKLTPNLEINTGISAQADKLVQSLNKTGLGI